MVTTKQYTFNNVMENHTISAEFETDPDPPTPGTGTSIRMFVKISGSWTPLFQ